MSPKSGNLFFPVTGQSALPDHTQLLRKAVVDDVKTEYFWFFSNFVDLKDIDIGFRPEQHEREQIHVWHTDANQEGNVMLIPTRNFKKQMYEIDFLRDYKDINYHRQSNIFHIPLDKLE